MVIVLTERRFSSRLMSRVEIDRWCRCGPLFAVDGLAADGLLLMFRLKALGAGAVAVDAAKNNSYVATEQSDKRS